MDTKLPVKEIAFSGKGCYLYKESTITSTDVEKKCASIPYKPIRDNGEVDHQIPPINIPFYGYVFKHMNVPQEAELFKAYVASYSFTAKHLEGRINRAYPSLIRELHFFLLLVESASFQNVKYSLQKDLKGVDVSFDYGGINYGLEIYLASPNSKKYRETKDAKHPRKSGVISFEMEFKDCHKFGEIFLAKRDTVSKLKGFLDDIKPFIDRV